MGRVSRVGNGVGLVGHGTGNGGEKKIVALIPCEGLYYLMNNYKKKLAIYSLYKSNLQLDYLRDIVYKRIF